MEVRIGVVYTARELVVDMEEDSMTVSGIVESAIKEGDALLWLTDTKGKRIGVPTDKIAYVEIAGDTADRKVGFGSR